MRIIGNDQKNNGQNFWEILERIIGKISSIIGAGLSGDSASDCIVLNMLLLNGGLIFQDRKSFCEKLALLYYRAISLWLLITK